MDNPDWWILVAMMVTPVFIMAFAAIAYALYLDKKIEEEERHLRPAE
jgi:hypothetical protein